MKNEMKNDEAVSPVIATILMVAITVVLAGVLYVWASSLAGDSTGETLDTYVWSATDADKSSNPGSAGGEDLVRMSMDGGSGLNWGSVKITVELDGATPLTCVLENTEEDQSTAECLYTQYGNEGSGNEQEWEVGEGVVISEGTGGCTSSCSVQVNVYKKGAGNAADKVVGTASAAA